MEFSPLSTPLHTNYPTDEILPKLKSPIGFVLFYDPACGACQAYLPQYNKICQQINKENTFFHLHYPSHTKVDDDPRWANPHTIPRLFLIRPKHPPRLINRALPQVLEIWNHYNQHSSIPLVEDTTSQWGRFASTPSAQPSPELTSSMFSPLQKIKPVSGGRLHLPRRQTAIAPS